MGFKRRNDRRRDQDLFGAAQIAAWRARTAELNREGRGDQSMFILARKPAEGV